jgi:hypothetical protein
MAAHSRWLQRSAKNCATGGSLLVLSKLLALSSFWQLGSIAL